MPFWHLFVPVSLQTLCESYLYEESRQLERTSENGAALKIGMSLVDMVPLEWVCTGYSDDCYGQAIVETY